MKAPAKAAAPAAPVARLATPPQVFQFHSGDQVIRGAAERSVSAVRIKIFATDGRLVQQNDALVDKTDLRYFAGLRSPLEANQVVQVYAVVSGRELGASNPMLVAGDAVSASAQVPLRTTAAAVQWQPTGNGSGPHEPEGNEASAVEAGNGTAKANSPLKSGGSTSAVDSANGQQQSSGGGGQQQQTVTPPVPVKPEIRNSPAPGQADVAVNATPTIDNTNQEVRIYPIRNGTPVGAKVSGNVQPYMVTDSKGQALITLEEPLTSEDVVLVRQQVVKTTDNTVVGTDLNSEPKSITDPLDLGRVRYYFTSGVVLSNNHGFQSQSSGTDAGLFLGLDADRAWKVAKGKNSWGLNTYFDARLTSVATQTAGSQTQGSGGTTSNMDSFLKSQKAASLQTGTYIPWITADWPRSAESYSFFLAPLAKAGFTTLTDTQDTAAGGSGTTTVSQPLTDRFFTSYAYGARLGVFHNFREKDGSFSNSAAPDLVSYVDVTTGKFGNFEAFRDLTLEGAAKGASPPQPHELLRQRPWRYSFEGLFKIAHSVFIVGFNANIGHGALGPDKVNGIIRPYTQPRDDLRFLFGARLDFSKFLSALPKLQ